MENAPEVSSKCAGGTGAAALSGIDGLWVREQVHLGDKTRFGIGGPADIYAETSRPDAFVAALDCCRRESLAHYILGDGSNVIVSDQGFRGVVLRFVGRALQADGLVITADAGAQLQEAVDLAIARGLRGLESLTGIPGSVGAAIYGNAGAYGHSISERAATVLIFDGSRLRDLDNAACEFDYRESVFKRHKDWMIFQVRFALDPSDAGELRRAADAILAQRNDKFPPAMKCAGSIFKNLLVRDLPPALAAAIPPDAIREGKVASAYFLEQVGAKGSVRGQIRVADYHANLIYNAGGGAAADLRALVLELKHRVQGRFGIELEEEVQYVGDFSEPVAGIPAAAGGSGAPRPGASS